MGIKSYHNLLFRSVPLSFKQVMRVIKSRHNAIKNLNEMWTYPVVFTDANLIACKTPAGADPAKYVDLIVALLFKN